MPAKSALGRAARCAAVLAAALAILLALINRTYPQLFLRIPEYGYLLWALGGNPMPPTFDWSHYSESNFRLWCRDGDIVVSTMAKAGSVWVQNIVHLLKTGGDDSYDRIQDVFGLVEMLRHPGDTNVAERAAREAAKRVEGLPMQHFSHKYPRPDAHGLQVHLHPRVRYVCLARNGREVVVSMVAFFQNRPKEFRRLWGGFPPPKVSIEQVLRVMTVTSPGYFFGYLLHWWPHRRAPNVHLSHYADLKRNLRREAARLAYFLGIDAAAHMDVVVEKAGFAYMKARAEKFRLWTGPDLTVPLVANHINEGRTGGAGARFSAEMNRTWEAAVEEHFGHDPTLIAWAENGGELPP